jgi:hypothetical protein
MRRVIDELIAAETDSLRAPPVGCIRCRLVPWIPAYYPRPRREVSKRMSGLRLETNEGDAAQAHGDI